MTNYERLGKILAKVEELQKLQEDHKMMGLQELKSRVDELFTMGNSLPLETDAISNQLDLVEQAMDSLDIIYEGETGLYAGDVGLYVGDEGLYSVGAYSGEGDLGRIGFAC